MNRRRGVQKGIQTDNRKYQLSAPTEHNPQRHKAREHHVDKTVNKAYRFRIRSATKGLRV